MISAWAVPLKSWNQLEIVLWSRAAIIRDTAS